MDSTRQSSNPCMTVAILFLQPALSDYQCRLHHELHGPEEPIPEPLAKRQKSGTVKPIKSRTTSPLPQLPGDLLEKQKSLTELRCDISPKPAESSSVHPMFNDMQRANTSARNSAKRKKISALLLNNNPCTVVTRYSPPLEMLKDPLEIVERLKKEPELGFIYLSPVNDFKSVRYNPYNLRYVRMPYSGT